MSYEKPIFDINTSNKLELSVNDNHNGILIKIKVDKKEEDDFISSAWMTIAYEDLDDLIKTIEILKKKIEDNM